MSKRFITRTEFNAIMGGLRMIQSIEGAWPRAIGEILADDAECITCEGIDTLCEALNFGEVQLETGDQP